MSSGLNGDHGVTALTGFVSGSLPIASPVVELTLADSSVLGAIPTDPKWACVTSSMRCSSSATSRLAPATGMHRALGRSNGVHVTSRRCGSLATDCFSRTTGRHRSPGNNCPNGLALQLALMTWHLRGQRWAYLARSPTDTTLCHQVNIHAVPAWSPRACVCRHCSRRCCTRRRRRLCHRFATSEGPHRFT